MKRRDFLALSATALTVPSAFAARPDVSGVKSRPAAKWEIYYKSPHEKPNDLDIQPDGLWVLDQGTENWMSLVNPADGKLIREFKQADVEAASGITVDEEGVMWIGSTYGNMIVSCDSHTGKTIAKYWTPGAGRIYQMKGDAPGRSSKLKPAYPAPPREGGSSNARARLPYGQLPLDTKQGAGGTGAHGIVAKDGLLYIAVPPARQIFVMDKKTWEVQDSWHLPGNRTHGLTWDENRETLWNADSNLNAFFRLDGKSGRIIEKIQLPDDSPVIHGATLHEGRMICCDDVGWIWGFNMA